MRENARDFASVQRSQRGDFAEEFGIEANRNDLQKFRATFCKETGVPKSKAGSPDAVGAPRPQFRGGTIRVAA